MATDRKVTITIRWAKEGELPSPTRIRRWARGRSVRALYFGGHYLGTVHDTNEREWPYAAELPDGSGAYCTQYVHAHAFLLTAWAKERIHGTSSRDHETRGPLRGG